MPIFGWKFSGGMSVAVRYGIRSVEISMKNGVGTETTGTDRIRTAPRKPTFFIDTVRILSVQWAKVIPYRSPYSHRNFVMSYGSYPYEIGTVEIRTA